MKSPLKNTEPVKKEKKDLKWGCGKRFGRGNSGYICGIANAWGQERLCPKCRKKWGL